MTSLRLALAGGVVAAAVFAVPAAAQERTSEEHEVRHVYDETPEWESPADADVTLEAPAELTICRQGRIVSEGALVFAHMGCWGTGATAGDSTRRLSVPTGLAYIGVRRGLDLEWLGGGVSLFDGSILHLRVTDNLPVRIAGWSLFGVALVTAVVGVVGMLLNWFGSSTVAPIAVTASAAALVFVGLGLAFVNDGLEVSVGEPAAPHVEPASSPP